MQKLIRNVALILHLSFRQLDADIIEDFLTRIGDEFGVERTEAIRLYSVLQQCMEHRESVSQNTLGPVRRHSI